MLSSRYNCSSSIDDEALAATLGDCLMTQDCVTSYNQYYGGWATVVENEIVVGDLTEETQNKFHVQYIFKSELLASISWYSESGVTVYRDYAVPWRSFLLPTDVIVEQRVLEGFENNESESSFIEVLKSGTYYITYSISIVGSGALQCGISVSSLPDQIYAVSLVQKGTGTNLLSGSCICSLTQNAKVALKNFSPTSPSFVVSSVSISIRVISP